MNIEVSENKVYTDILHNSVREHFQFYVLRWVSSVPDEWGQCLCWQNQTKNECFKKGEKMIFQEFYVRSVTDIVSIIDMPKEYRCAKKVQRLETFFNHAC